MPPKSVTAVVKLELDAGAASVTTVGKALGARGINLGEFMRAYNEATAGRRGTVVPAHVTIYEDRSFAFVTRTPPTAKLLAKAAGVEKGSARPGNGTGPVGWVSAAQLREIARVKLPDLNTEDLDAAERMVAGTARQMGIAVRG
jgi:large subunit ribosomal protein L11